MNKDEQTAKQIYQQVKAECDNENHKCKLYDLSVSVRINKTCSNISKLIPDLPENKRKAFVIQLGKNILQMKGKE